jgi:hypothetical protein
MSGEELRCSSIDQEIGDGVILERELKYSVYTQFILNSSQTAVGVLMEFRRKLMCFDIGGKAGWRTICR